MIIKEILAEISARPYPFSPETFPKYQDIVANAGKQSPFTIYPDESRSIGDIVSVMGMITSEGSPLLTIANSFLIHRKAGGVQVEFEDGLRTPPHTHNYAELGYVAEGQFHTHIEGREYLFSKGDLFLINKKTSHNECLYQRNSVVLFLSIANTFFDKNMHHEVYDSRTEKFIQRFIINTGGESYGFFLDGGGGAIASYVLSRKKKIAGCRTCLKKSCRKYGGPIRGQRILSSVMWNGYSICFRRNTRL
jgi:mannose-6-phosphate isomerase-like protein (cupin superfamily)